MTWKLLGILILLVGVILTVPSLREEVRPQIEFVLRPVYKYNTKNRVNEIRRVLDREQSLGRPVPSAREFPAFLAKEAGAQAARDTWGEPFYLVSSRREYRVGSKGPDRLRGTEDDILSQATPKTGRSTPGSRSSSGSGTRRAPR